MALAIGLLVLLSVAIVSASMSLAYAVSRERDEARRSLNTVMAENAKLRDEIWSLVKEDME